MAFMDFLLGTKEKTKTQPIYTPEQEQVLGQALGGLQQQLPMGLQNLMNILGGDPGTFEAFGAPARRQFEQKTLPSIAERFTGQLGEGSQRSSAFGQQLGEAGRDLEENLFAKRLGLQSGALEQLLQLLGPALMPLQQQITTGRQPGFLENLGLATAQGFGGAIGGGIPGAIKGGLGGLMKLLGGGGAAAAQGASQQGTSGGPTTGGFKWFN